jgi:preprotein translocase subunit SecA
MAGRGTDIKLAPGVADKGGLHVIGTERHESRRIDNQLRGRAGRQGDPGSSRFFVSFGDDIMKRFSPEWVPGMMEKLGMTEDMPLESRMVTRAIEQSQTKVEGHNFDVRKRLVEFDDVINEHRAVIYGEREKVLRDADTRENVVGLLLDEIEEVCKRYDGSIATLEIVHAELGEILMPEDMPTIDELEKFGDEMTDEMMDRAEDRFEQLEDLFGEENMRKVEHWLLIESIDQHWREHLTAIEDLRQSIGLQAYAQIDPLVAFKREGYDMFQQLQENIRRQVARTVFKVKVQEQRPAAASNGAVATPNDGDATATPALARSSAPSVTQLRPNRGDTATVTAARSGGPAVSQKIGRNDPCYCGSGKKYKKCHGAVA